MVTTLTQPVDENGNISFSPTEGLSIPISEQNSSGTVVNIATLLRMFHMPQLGFSKALALDPSNPTGRLLLLTDDELRAVNSSTGFQVNDEDGVVPITLWEGVISIRNSYDG